MKEKTAMEKMVGYLEDELRDTRDFDRVEIITKHLDEARRLLKEGQEQKPTAPASLIKLCEELLDMVEFPYFSQGDESDTGTMVKSDSFDFDKAKETLSRYRPAPTREEGLREAVLEIVRTEPELPGEPDEKTIKAMNDVGPIMNARIAARTTKECIAERLEEYFSRHPVPSKSALVEELREKIDSGYCDCDPHYGYVCIGCEIKEIISRHTGEQGKEGEK